jgi:hypothetical protein
MSPSKRLAEETKISCEGYGNGGVAYGGALWNCGACERDFVYGSMIPEEAKKLGNKNDPSPPKFCANCGRRNAAV